MWKALTKRRDGHPPVRVRMEREGAAPAEQLFAGSFRIGRGEDCEVTVSSHLASRVHAEVVYEEGGWWVRDLGSTNGTYLEDRRIARARLEGCATLRLGEDGPPLLLAVGDEAAEAPPAPAKTVREAAATPSPAPDRTQTPRTQTPAENAHRSGRSTREAAAARASGTPRPAGSVTRYVERYFGDGNGPAGEHTQMLRAAYARVKRKRQRTYYGIIAAILVVLVGVVGYAVVQHRQNQQLQQAAQAIFYQVKAQDLAVSELKRYIEETGDASLAKQLAALEARRQELAASYAGYVRELGVRRRLTEEEELIYQTARIFNESEFGMPAGFVRRVQETIRTYWLTPAGRGRFERAVERAEEQGYTPYIVETMRDYGLPPEFFYLALQESNFDARAVGPPTRWGIAKGMWQFIPSTGRAYGLCLGPRKDLAIFDPQDERHDFEAATEAAARYLQDIYSTLAQASGLLVMASYNWGEHRVKGKLEDLPGPQAIPEVALEGIPDNPKARNYWRFLNEYEDRMPEQTKDYVIKIFAAAVIGRNPRQFGFDFDNPLRKYMTASVGRRTADGGLQIKQESAVRPRIGVRGRLLLSAVLPTRATTTPPASP